MVDHATSCSALTAALLFVSCGGLAYFIVRASGPQKAPAPWRWGDKPRRPSRASWGHLAGAALCALMIGAAISHPLCQ